MRIATAQINPVLGDFTGNAAKILTYAQRARERRCDLVVFPEASLFGYHPMDLLERPPVVEAQLKVLQQLRRKWPKGITGLVGAITKNDSGLGKPYFNAAVLIERGRPLRIFPKELLPTYDVFDEARHIEPGDVSKNIIRFKGKRILLTICEDIWAWPGRDLPRFTQYGKNPLLKIPKSKVDLVINLSASPFTKTKRASRLRVTQNTVRRFSCPLVYVNLVGAQDELIFDGGSFVLDRAGKLLSQSAYFVEDLNVVDLREAKGGHRTVEEFPEEILRQAVVLGLRDFVEKTGFDSVHLGLSGGIDSALVACLAVDALGASRVKALAMPSQYNSPKSLRWAREISSNLGIELLEFPIQGIFDQTRREFDRKMKLKKFSLVHENMQARIRGLVLMAYANKTGSLLLGTSNKSELAMGFATLYGDMCSAIQPIGDFLKSEVLSLARHYNSGQELIPRGVIERPPSAELAPNQIDEDRLPEYRRLDPAVEKLVGGYQAAKGPIERRVLTALYQSEFKRWQAAPILKVSDHAFGRGRRLPLAHRARD